MADYNNPEDREGNKMLWCGYVSNDNEVVISRYFNQFDLETVKLVKTRKKLIDPFWAENIEKAKEKASRLCQS